VASATVTKRKKILSSVPRSKHRSMTGSSHEAVVPLCKGGGRGSEVFSIYVKKSLLKPEYLAAI
jgi:hypothetical protein